MGLLGEKRSGRKGNKEMKTGSGQGKKGEEELTVRGRVRKGGRNGKGWFLKKRKQRWIQKFASRKGGRG